MVSQQDDRGCPTDKVTPFLLLMVCVTHVLYQSSSFPLQTARWSVSLIRCCFSFCSSVSQTYLAKRLTVSRTCVLNRSIILTHPRVGRGGMCAGIGEGDACALSGRPHPAVELCVSSRASLRARRNDRCTCSGSLPFPPARHPSRLADLSS